MALLRHIIVCVLFTGAFAKELTSQRSVTKALNVSKTNIINDRNVTDNFMGRENLVEDSVSISYNRLLRRRTLVEDNIYRISYQQNKSNTFGSDNNDIYDNASQLTDCNFDSKFITCIKLKLLENISRVLKIIEEYDKRNIKFEMMNGLVSLENINGEGNTSDINVYQNFVHFKEDDQQHTRLDLLIASGITKLFQNRILSVNFVPGLSLRVLPSEDKSSLLNVSVKYLFDIHQHQLSTTGKQFSKTNIRINKKC
jgi:hypothetical protein